LFTDVSTTLPELRVRAFESARRPTWTPRPSTCAGERGADSRTREMPVDRLEERSVRPTAASTRAHGSDGA